MRITFSIVQTMVLLVSLSSANVYAIGTNFRAQGDYYSAKESYEKQDYSAALQYVYKSKELLGGTNEQLEYLHIMSAYYGGNYAEAKKEMQTFFDIEERRLKPVAFGNDVDRLTDRETHDLTMMINKIDESVERQKQEVERQRQQAEANKKMQEEDDAAAENINGEWVAESNYEIIGDNHVTISGSTGHLIMLGREGNLPIGRSASIDFFTKKIASADPDKIVYMGGAGYLVHKNRE